MSTVTHPLVGIVGGFGPDTTAAFCSRLVRHAHAQAPDRFPAFAVDFVAASPELSGRAIAGSAAAAAALVAQINASMARLQTMGVHTVALPCNTMHLFREQFRLPPGVRFLDLIATVTEVLRRRRVRRVGLLATGLTVQSGLYHRTLQAQGLTVHVPDPSLQARLARGIGAYVRTGSVGPAAARALSAAIANATAAGVDALVLGCTDIGGMLPQVDVRCTLPIIDSMDVLAEHCAALSV